MNSSSLDPTRPVIIGASIGGLVVSDALCRAGVPHVLVGDAPGAGMRLGESLDWPASVALPNLFPHLRRFFHHKGGVIGVFGEQRVDLIFGAGKLGSLRVLFKLMGLELLPALYQIDRIGFDAALHAEVSTHPMCTWLPGRVAELEYDAVDDRIASLRLPDGRVLRPRFVFDGSGPARVVGRAAKLAREFLSAPHRAAVAHVTRPPGSASWWTPHTTLLRLYEPLHGVDGGVWCIPLNEVISIGVSASADTLERIDDARLLELGLAGLRRAGVDIDGAPPLRRLGARYRYSRLERDVGANYLLIGAAGISTWWLSSTGVGTALAAAAIAPDLAQGRRGVLPRYRRYMDQVAGVHGLFERLMSNPIPPRSGAELRPVYEPLMRGNLVRLAMYAHLARRRWPAELLAPALRELVGRFEVGDVVGIEQRIELGAASAGEQPSVTRLASADLEPGSSRKPVMAG